MGTSLTVSATLSAADTWRCCAVTDGGTVANAGALLGASVGDAAGSGSYAGCSPSVAESDGGTVYATMSGLSPASDYDVYCAVTTGNALSAKLCV